MAPFTQDSCIPRYLKAERTKKPANAEAYTDVKAQKRGNIMRVGVPSEIKPGEHRVGLTPTAVREYVAHGHQVLVQQGAGLGAGYADETYVKAGATIAPDADAVFAGAEMIVKVKEPQKVEWERLTERHILFTYLHLAPDPAQTEGLIKSGCAAIAYETVTDAKGGLPLLAPMSEVAGRIAVFSAAETLLKHNGGMGLLLCGVPGVPPARVAVLGGGVVGSNAARMAAGLGAEVVVLERSIPRMRELDDLYQGRILTRYSTLDAVEEEILKADVVIGAVLTAGAAAPKLVRREHLSRMKPGSVLVDVSIDQGGCFETSHPTTHAEPTYTVDGVVHYCVANMPGAAPRTSSDALGNATLPFGLALADKGLDALEDNIHLARGLNVLGGKLTHPAVAQALVKDFVDPFGVWGGSKL
jgi:alanine dehydrogenase